VGKKANMGGRGKSVKKGANKRCKKKRVSGFDQGVGLLSVGEKL